MSNSAPTGKVRRPRRAALIAATAAILTAATAACEADEKTQRDWTGPRRTRRGEASSRMMEDITPQGEDPQARGSSVRSSSAILWGKGGSAGAGIIPRTRPGLP